MSTARDIARAIGRACEAVKTGLFQRFVVELDSIEFARNAVPADAPAASSSTTPAAAGSTSNTLSSHALVKLLPAKRDEVFEQPENHQDDLLLRAVCFVQWIWCRQIDKGIDILTHKCTV